MLTFYHFNSLLVDIWLFYGSNRGESLTKGVSSDSEMEKSFDLHGFCPPSSIPMSSAAIYPTKIKIKILRNFNVIISVDIIF